jgi:hypothetical protein
MNPIEPGDVALDLAQGRPVQVVDHAADSVTEWEQSHDYDLLENYGNKRLNASADDTVWTCVYVGQIRSRPTKSYDFPESRLARIETEAALGERVQAVIVREFVRDVLNGSDTPETTKAFLKDSTSGKYHDTIQNAAELAEVDQLREDDR